VPNTVYGAGTNIGDAVVLYNGPAYGGYDALQSIEAAGLLPNTDYYIYAFAYDGVRGAESYKITAAQRNPNMLSTLRGNDDDITLGGRHYTSETYRTSQTVGTNAPFIGMIYPIGDQDCFNFMVTSAAPNVRVLLTHPSGNYEMPLPGNYTLELYDFTGRRIRRSELNGKASEALVVNDLPPGTYVVRVFSADQPPTA